MLLVYHAIKNVVKHKLQHHKINDDNCSQKPKCEHAQGRRHDVRSGVGIYNKMHRKTARALNRISQHRHPASCSYSVETRA